MKSLISRESHRREKRYSGVYHIQGGMVTDADLDERSRITQDRTDNLGDDSIKDGVPQAGGAVAVAADGSLSLREGVIYADGLRGVLTSESGEDPATPFALFSDQADFPESPGLPAAGNRVIYADIWERPVFPLEDPYLADAGLHGAVTAFRTRTMTQLKSAPLAALGQVEAGTDAFPRIGTAIVEVTPLNAEILADDCDPCAEVVSAEQTISNALWRLEVIGITGKPNVPGKVTLAWSVENAAAIATADVDHESFARNGKVYEYYSEITESHIGVFAKASDAKRPAFVADLGTPPDPAKDYNGKPWPYVRRWDGQAVIDTGGAAIAIKSKMGGGFQISVDDHGPRPKVKLLVGAFEATIDLLDAAIVVGDYWLVELRHSMPKDDRVNLIQDTPFGVNHHYCVLFRINAAGEIMPPTDAEIRKLSFPVLANLPATHVAFDNDCESGLFGDAENVQEALTELCDISADKVAFKSNCQELYGAAADVQTALDALCKIDFSVRGSFRLLFDWGVICGIVPSLVKIKTGRVNIPAGAFIDRAGEVRQYKGQAIDLSSLNLNENILFGTAQSLQRVLAKGEVCLALAALEGGEVSIHVVPHSLAFGPDDPGFSEILKKCLEEKQTIDLDKVILDLSGEEQLVALKIVNTASGGGAFGGSAKLTQAEADLAAVFNGKLSREFKKRATEEEVSIFTARGKKAEEDIPVGAALGSAAEVRNMQLATATFEVFTASDEERMRRCLCQALFPTCPPDLGEAPFFVPIARLRGSYRQNKFLLDEVCPFSCRKQAMTWRSLQYFIGETRGKLAEKLSTICCVQEDPIVTKPPVIYDPGKYVDFRALEFLNEYRIFEEDLGRPPGPVIDPLIRFSADDLSLEEATKVVVGNGFELGGTIDIDDERAFELIESMSVGITPTDRLASGGNLRRGDKVALLVQDGIVRGHVLLERGSGKLPFATEVVEPGFAISPEEELKASNLIAATEIAKEDLVELASLREALSADVIALTENVAALGQEREEIAAAITIAEGQLGDLAETQAAMTEAIEVVNVAVAAAEESRKTIVAAVRAAQPITVVTGTENVELIAKFAAVGVFTMADLSKMSEATITDLKVTNDVNKNVSRRLRARAAGFLANPIG